MASGYNSAFWSWKRVGTRTSLIADPPNGRMPPLLPEAQKTAAAEREFRLAMLLATETCKDKRPAVQRRHLHADTLAAAGRAATALQHGTLQSQRRSGGQLARGAVPDRRATRVRRADRELPPHRADAGRYFDLLRRRAGPGLAAQHRHGRAAAPPGGGAPMVRRLARTLGGRHARRRRDELQPEDGLPGRAGEFALDRALDADCLRPRSNTP